MMMNHNLSIFISVAEIGSITKAAKTLFITQPAVSNAIHKLEKELDVRLFYRDKRNGLILTEVGQRVLTLAREMLALDNRIRQAALNDKGLIGGHLRIGTLPSLTATVVTQTLQEYRQLYPEVVIEIKEGRPREINEMVANHRVDLAVSAGPYGQFDHEKLLTDRIIAACSSGHRELSELNLTTTNETLVFNQPAFETILDNLNRRQPFVDMRQVIMVQSAEAAMAMVKADIGVGIISEYTLDSLGENLQKCPVTPIVNFDIGVFANDLSDVSPAAKEFIRILKLQAK